MVSWGTGYPSSTLLNPTPPQHSHAAFELNYVAF